MLTITMLTIVTVRCHKDVDDNAVNNNDDDNKDVDKEEVDNNGDDDRGYSDKTILSLRL